MTDSYRDFLAGIGRASEAVKGGRDRAIEIAAAEVVDKFNRAQWYLNDDCDGLDDDGCNALRELLMAALAAVRAETVEQAAKINEEWLKSGELLLACGEMSAQEIRTVKAVLTARAAAIRSLLKTGETDGR